MLSEGIEWDPVPEVNGCWGCDRIGQAGASVNARKRKIKYGREELSAMFRDLTLRPPEGATEGEPSFRCWAKGQNIPRRESHKGPPYECNYQTKNDRELAETLRRFSEVTLRRSDRTCVNLSPGVSCSDKSDAAAAVTTACCLIVDMSRSSSSLD